MYSLYSLLVLIVAVVASPWFIYQAVRYKKYVGNFGQRMGYLPVSFNMDADDSIWIHAVSVGEVLTARRNGNATDVVSQLLRETIRGRHLTDEEIVSILRNWTVGELATIAACVGILAHFVATVEKLPSAVAADITRAARDQDLHRRPIPS